jgi:predicted metalloprotease with PDZ domain
MRKTSIIAALIAAMLAANTSFAADSKSTSKSDDQASEELDAKLEAAQERLETAAKEVAELSARLARPVVDRLMIMGQPPVRSVIGVQLDPESGKDGARVVEVSPGGAAADAGVKAGDVIVALNGEKISDEHSARQVTRLMRDVKPKSKVKLRVMRDGKSQDFELTARAPVGFFVTNAIPGTPPLPTLAPRAAGIAMPMPPPGFDTRQFREFTLSLDDEMEGMELATLTPTLGKYFGAEKGVLVLRAPEGARFKVEDGDVILAIGGREPTSGSHATRILRSYQPGEKIELKVMRQHRSMNLEVTLPDYPKDFERETRGGPNVRFKREGGEAGADVHFERFEREGST